MQVEIQGILCSYRDLRQSTVDEDGVIHDGEEILYADLPQDEQYFRRIEHPFTDDELVDIANKEYSYTSVKKAWVENQENIFDTGLYAYIDGAITFIPGAYWCYINFWTLENGEKPDYREDDREFFLFHEYLRLETDCLANTRLKGRRQGATSIAMFFMWFIAGRNEHKNCGTTSFNDTACQDNFQRMFMYGFKAMLPCFQSDFDSDSENFIRFVKPVEKKRKGILAVKREGLNSYCDYKSNAINSYDSGRQSYNVPDEGAKRGAKVNINSYWSRVSKTLLIGVNKVGFAYLPTTVGAKNEGGENYEVFWKNSNQYEIDENTGKPVGVNTPTRCVQYFMAATRCYAGCIDKFGRSVIDDPIEPIMGNDGKIITEGAYTRIMRERSRLQGEQLMEHRRDYPLNIFDAFAFTAGACEFNEENIQTQIRWCQDNSAECFWRQMRLVPKKEEKKNIYNGKVTERKIMSPMDDKKGGWFILEYPNKPNNFSVSGGYYEPLNTLSYQIGVDTTQDRVAVSGSNPAITVFKKSILINEDGQLIEKGLYPVAMWVSPTRMDIHFDEEVLKACLWYGCKANYEIDRRTDFYRYFCKENCQAFLTWTPRVLQNPLKPNKSPEYGSRSGDPFQLAQMLQISKWYIDGDSQEKYNGHVHRIKHIPLLKEALYYDHLDRTKSDLFVSLQMALVAVFGEMQIPKTNYNPKPKNVLPVYKLKMTG